MEQRGSVDELSYKKMKKNSICFLNIILETLTIPLIMLTILCLNGREKVVLLSVNYWAIWKTHHKPNVYNTIACLLFYPIIFVIELLLYISNIYAKSHYDIELGMDPLLYFCAKYFHEPYIFMPFIEQKLTWYYDIITY